MPMLSIPCVFELPDFKPESIEYHLEAQLQRRRALHLMGKPSEWADIPFKGELKQKLSLQLVFSSPALWESYQKPANFKRLLFRIEAKIKQEYGQHWKVIKDKFDPSFGRKFQAEEITREIYLFV